MRRSYDVIAIAPKLESVEKRQNYSLKQSGKFLWLTVYCVLTKGCSIMSTGHFDDNIHLQNNDF